MNTPIQIPDGDHAITIAPSRHSVVVTVAGKVIADSARALVLREASHEPVFYIPRRDVDMALLKRTDHVTYCPYKGDAAHYSIPVGGDRSVNAAWSYEAPFAGVAAIMDHIAFYPERVDSIVEWASDYPSAQPWHDPALGAVEHAG